MNKTLFLLTLFFSFSCFAQKLYVGANFHPHDYETEDEINLHIAKMNEAGFSVVRLGHLAWDSFEPALSDYHEPSTGLPYRLVILPGVTSLSLDAIKKYAVMSPMEAL